VRSVRLRAEHRLQPEVVQSALKLVDAIRITPFVTGRLTEIAGPSSGIRPLRGTV